GATKGTAYINGIAGERFSVRNSGATVVVEGIGDHGCEYMTGGRVIVLGKTGRNFAAGMSGGIAYVWDPKSVFERNLNKEMVELEKLTDPEEIDFVLHHISKHKEYTDSKRAAELLSDWQNQISKFVKVIPTDYKKAMAKMKASNESKKGDLIHG
ncbi:MAG TPA: glutamate synthase subunit alpha, partial [Leptospiraceae bacterium]|nr:glutamate synthase subunit alpha [Leptospiraceae bacterium]